MTNSLIQDAGEEVKRAEHMLFISLKYTRTRDVMKNIMLRLIAAYEFVISAILEEATSKGEIGAVFDNWQLRAQAIKKIKSNYKPFIDVYILLKKMEEAPFSAREEFRKHINLGFRIDGKKIDVDVPVLTEYFKKTKEFVKYAESEVS